MKQRLLAVLLMCSAALAQRAGPGNLNQVGTSGPNSCVVIQLASNVSASVAIGITGTSSLTLQPSATVNGQPAVNVTVFPDGSTTGQGTIVTSGATNALYNYSTAAGKDSFQICVSAYTSGTAVVSLNASTANAKLGGTSAGGTVTAVTASAPLNSSGGNTPNITLNGIVPAANGGTGINNTATLTLGTANLNLATLGTGILKLTVTTGALSLAAGSDLPTGIPIGSVGSVGLSGTSPITIAATGAIGCATCVTSAAALNSTSFMTGAGLQASQTPNNSSTLDASGNAIFAGSVTSNGTGAALVQPEIADPGAPGASKDSLSANSSYHRWMIYNNNVGPKAVGTWGVTSAGGLQVGGSSAINGINTEILVAGNSSGLGVATETSAGVWAWIGASNASGTQFLTSSGTLTQNALLKLNASGDAIASGATENGTTLTYPGTAGMILNGVGSSLVETQGTITTTIPFISHTSTWNAGGVPFNNFLSNITCTAASANAKMFDWQIAGTSQFNLTYTGSNCATPQLNSLGAINFTGSTGASTTLQTTVAGQGVIVTGAVPASSSGAGTAAGAVLTATGVAGGATTGSATTAGVGSTIPLTAGIGGSGSGGTNAIGGAGGSITLTAGGGGASGGTAANSNGGSISLLAGAAGTGGSGAAGLNGSIIVNVGTATSPTMQATGSASNTGLSLTTTNLCWANGLLGQCLLNAGMGLGSAKTLAWSSTTSGTASFDTGLSRGAAAGLIDVGNGTAQNTTGFVKTAQTILVKTADVTCGTGGTLAPCTSLTTITGLSLALPLVATDWSFDCTIYYSQATGTAADQIGVQTATNGATNLTAGADAFTAAAVIGDGVITDVASTTTAQSVITFTPGATGSKQIVHLKGTIEGASASGTTFNVMVLTGAAADLLTIYRGSSCWVF